MKLTSRAALAGFILALTASARQPAFAQDTATIARHGREILPGLTLLTDYDRELPELADPYVTFFKDSAIVSGTAQYFLKFRSLDEIRRGGPYQVVWNDFYYADGTPMEGAHRYAHSWDMKPSLWPSSTRPGEPLRLWDPNKDTQPPLVVWYGGHMRPRTGAKTSRWPDDNYSRDVFSFVEKTPGKWFSMESSIFPKQTVWPRAAGNYLTHRYGHQIVMVPKLKKGIRTLVPTVFYEQVTEVRDNGSPAITRIFSDEMSSPFSARGRPVELLSPINPATGKVFPSALREDGSALVEGPLYFRFFFEGKEWEALGFSSGSYYGRYPSCFASRKVSDGMRGKPYRLDLTDDGTDLHDAGAAIGALLNLTGGPGRPAVVARADGKAIAGPGGQLQVLVHAYHKEMASDFRMILSASLKITRKLDGALRFDIVPSRTSSGTKASVRYNHCEVPGRAVQSGMPQYCPALARCHDSARHHFSSHHSRL